eukprot:CAMPEP_0119517304 /NCGR_PEP_ID=MMETSP1344-20130328/34234_1 /TAXON_ID=236787 /ORGANISM="Florenciella parvula, Strain CCMP2471" /LENGTH=204 /DNA_ID=CAMNT_0007554881 /DNA_START=18 /DNA_END=632 /DNA_ORIENTATION=-
MQANIHSAARSFQFKLVLLGDTAVGKSCLVVRFVRDEFFEFQEPTIGAAFLTQTVSRPTATVKFEIWDTAGQERYHSLAPMYYRDAAAAVVVYDITNPDSFESAKKWIRELQSRGSPDVLIALAGNKSDLEEKRSVEHAEVETWAAQNGCLHFATSAKDGDGVRLMFDTVADKLPKEKPQDPVSSGSFPVIPPAKKAKQNEVCC